MKKRRLLAMAAILFCVIGLFSFSGCTAKYKLSIKNEPNIAVLSRLKTRYAAGEQVMVVTEVVLDADVEVFLNGQSIGKQTAVYTENGGYELISGYDQYNVTIYNPTTKEARKMGLNDASQYFSNVGNDFVCGVFTE